MENEVSADNIKTPFFLVGAVRSGTTLLRLMLGHHPNICRCNEMEYVTPAIVKHRGIPDDLADYKEFLSSEKNFRFSGYSVLENAGFVDVAQDFFRQLQEKDKKPMVGAAVHHHYEELPRVWPDSKYIFLIRDPRDVARSCAKMGWNGTAWGGAGFWIDAYESWLKLSAKVPTEKKLEITYEALIADPEAILKKVCSFLNVEYTPTMMEIDKDTTYSKPSAKEARSWRDSASDDEVMQVETRLGKRLEESGYQSSGLPALKMNFYNKTRLKIQDVVNRVAFRCKRYGFFLWLATVITNRFSLGSFNKKVKLQVQEIDIKYHK